MTDQASRFASYGKSSVRPASNNFSSPSKWSQTPQNSLWAAPLLSSFGNRESQTSLNGHDDSFVSTSNSESTSNFPPVADSAGVWSHSVTAWNNDSTPRKSSASPPSTRRESQPYHELPPSSTTNPYLASRVASSSNFTTSSRSTPGGAALDSNGSPFRYSSSLASIRDSISDASDGANGTSSFPAFGFESETGSLGQHGSQDLSNGAFPSTTAPTNASVSVSATASNPSGSLSSFSTISSSHGGHGHRSSLQAPISFSSTTAANSAQRSYPQQRLPQATDDQVSLALADLMMQQKLGVVDRDVGTAIASAYAPSSAPMSFQMNPGSQPWDTFDPLTAAAFAAARGNLSGLDRGTTSTGAPYRQMNSPRGLGATSTIAGQWNRPSSRDPRTAGFADVGLNGAMNGILQRVPPQNLALGQQQQQQLAAAAAVASFASAPNFFPASVPNVASYYNTFRTPLSNSQLDIHQLGTSFLAAPAMQVSRERDPTYAFRSPLLDEYRATRTSRKYELKDIYDHIVEFSGDQHGSRFIQSKLESANSDEKEHVFREISANTLVLMQDVFGNYVVQKFFEHGNQVQKKYLAEQMRGKMLDLSTQTYACRVVQKALQHILVDQQVALAKELESDVIRVVKDPNGNHVIQKVIELVPREHIGFIVDAFRGRVRELSAHNYGCRVVQRMLEHGLEEDKELILSELHDNASDLISDQYGNYVAQHVIQYGKLEDKIKVINRVLDQLVAMSNNKFASNVVEKCIEFGSAADRERIQEELARVGSDGQPVLQQMIKDQYGNYVIQKLLKQLKGEEFKSFARALTAQLVALRRSGTGRQNAAIDRLATAVAEMSKANHVSMADDDSKKTSSETASPPTKMVETTSYLSNPPESPPLHGDQDSMPSLASVPTTPESFTTPSVSAGSSGGSLDCEGKDSTAIMSNSMDPGTVKGEHLPAII